MPQAASALESAQFLNALILGAAKSGKTTAVITSMATTFGTGYVMCCSARSALQPAVRRTKKFEYDLIRDENDMEACLKYARDGVKEGKYKWLLLDDFSLYAGWLEKELKDASASKTKSGEANGMAVYSELKGRLTNIARRLLDIKAHIIMTAHYVDSPKELDGQRSKTGPGIMPLIPGAAREEIPALFQDVIFMEKETAKDGDRRVFKINPQGVWGPGCRSTDETKVIDADLGVFFKLGQESAKGRK
jgi:hypothetical protein